MFYGVLHKESSALIPHNKMGTDPYQLLKGDLHGLWKD